MQQILVFGRRLTDYMDRLSDSLTTFRLLLYILLTYLAAGVVLGFSGHVQHSGAHILISAVWLLVVCKGLNIVFSRLFNVPINHDSDLITALILALILSPADSLDGFLILGAAGMVAMLSKYVISYNGRHIFNPAALGAFTAGVLFHTYASWWIVTNYMVPFLLVGGFLIVRKMRRLSMVLIFIIAYFVYKIFLEHLIFGTSLPSWHSLYLDATITPLLFFASVMLTEPLTSPSKLQKGVIYALVVAVFYSVTRLRIPPEEALLIGNAIAFIIEPNKSILLKLTGRQKEAAAIYSFSFKPSKKLPFKPGQYLEWTLPGVAVDARGNRRYLTISSSPTENDLSFTVKIPSEMSKFKKRLISLAPGQQIVATRLAGDFLLPEDRSQKLAFIAGGVGITPFRSMIKQMIDTGDSYDSVLFYAVNTAKEIAFKDLLSSQAAPFLKTNYITAKEVNPGYLHGYLDGSMIEDKLPDYKQRHFYLSGPQGFVANIRIALLQMGVQTSHIKTDFFPGYN